MKQLMSLLILAGLATFSFAQSATTYTSSTESDPQAKVVLDKLRGKYEAYKTIQAQFSLAIEIPEQDKIVQKGTIAQAGDSYRVDMDDQSIISDGKSLWFHQKANKEVQINDVEEGDDDLLSPKALMTIYEKDDYIYALVNEYVEKGILIQQVEFKPIDKEESEYTKIRLTVDKKKAAIKRIKVFSRDGSRYTFELNEFKPNPSFPNGHFAFDESKHPDVHVEDLRF